MNFGRLFSWRYLTTAIVALNLGLSPVQAQDYEENYASVQGWSVDAIYNASGFFYCSANTMTRGYFMRMGLLGNQWAIGMETDIIGEYDGEIYVDGVGGNVAYTHYPDGWATTLLDRDQVNQMKRGRTVSLNIGDGIVDFSLSGSTAAMLKTEECARNYGGRPTQTARNTPTTTPQTKRSAPTITQQPSGAQQSTSNKPSIIQPAQQRAATSQSPQISMQQACNSGEQYLPKSELCTDEARKYMNITGINDFESGPGCSWSVNETLLPSDDIVLYEALRCDGVTAELGFAGGAHYSNLEVATSTMGGRRSGHCNHWVHRRRNP